MRYNKDSNSRRLRTRRHAGPVRRGRSGDNRGGGRRFKSRGSSIDPRLFVQASTKSAASSYTPTHTFADFALAEQLNRNIQTRGFDALTPIQDQAIEPILAGRDLVGIAATGTGKTAAFLIPLINKMYKDRKQTVLIIAPTRELAVQIENEFRSLTRGMDLYALSCIGGVPIGRQLVGLKRDPSVVIGTPGRLKDLEQRGQMRFGTCENLVIDEIDRMLDMGFIEDIRYIISKLPAKRQSLFFSATMSTGVEKIMNEFLDNPVRVTVKSAVVGSNVEQKVVKIQGKEKIEVLHDLLKQPEFKKVLVFAKTKWGIERMAKVLDERGMEVSVIHGNKTQGQRQRALTQFKTDRVRVLLATDVASRGLHIEHVTHVINYDQPQTYDDYIHRIGRTGRVNATGVALTFVD